MLVPQSGVFAVPGGDIRDGFQLYLDQNQGALGGRPVNVVIEDTEANPEVGLRKAQKLLRQDKVDLTTGIVSSAVALGVRDLFHEEQKLLVISNAGANDLTRKAKSPYIFRTAISNYQFSAPSGKWMYDNVAKDGVFVIAADYAAGREHVAAFRETFEKAGGKVIGDAYPAFGKTQDYQPFLSQIKSAGAKAVWCFFAGAEAVTFVKQYKEFGLKDSVPLVSNGALTDDTVVNAQGDAALGVRTSLHYTSLLDNPANKRFVELYTKKYSRRPSFFSMQSWDAAQFIDAALKQTKGETGDVNAVVKAMEGAGSIDSPRGPLTIDAKTHNSVNKFYMLEVRRVEGVGLANVVIAELGTFADPG